MRKIILNLTVSLDGYIEGPNGEYDWCFTDQDYGMSEFLAQTDAVFCGRKSYELLIEAGDEILAEKNKYVFSSSLNKVYDGWILVKDVQGETIQSILAKPGKNIWLFGGSQLTDHFIKLGLLDEMIISIHPLLLGDGTPLFRKMKERLFMKLVDAKIYDSGLAQLTYRIP
ncbi:MAG: dihydrofolate reductase [Saprospiraceae bacterium]|nr:dihydrofolate reductase [Saprospiraceae bacterium]